MTYSEYLRIMEVMEAKIDNATIDIDFMVESAKSTHKIEVADLDYRFKSSDLYTDDVMAKMYLEESEAFDNKMRTAWSKFCVLVNSIIEKMNSLKPDEASKKSVIESHPNGIEVSFDVKTTVKAMMKLSPMMTSSNMKKLTTEMRNLEKEDGKVTVDLKKDGKYSSGLDKFASSGNDYIMSCSNHSPTKIDTNILFEYVTKTIEFATKIQKMCEEIKSWKDDVPTWAITPLKEILSTSTSVVVAGSKALSTVHAKTKEGKKNTTTANLDASKTEKKNALKAPVATNKNSLQTTKKVEESAPIDDGTVFSTFFESSDIALDYDRTDAFLKSENENVKEMSSIMKSFM